MNSDYCKNCNLIFVLRNSRNILLKSISYGLEWLHWYGALAVPVHKEIASDSAKEDFLQPAIHHRSVSTRAYRGAEAPTNTDHVLVTADLVFTIMKPKKTGEVRRPYDVDRLSNCNSTTASKSKTSSMRWVLYQPASGSHCARSFANWQMKSMANKRTFVNLGYPRTPTTSHNLRPQQTVNRTMLSDTRLQGIFRARTKADWNNWSDLIFSRPRSEGWPHHGRIRTCFLHLSPSSVILTDSSTESPVHVLMLSIQAMHGLPRLRTPGIVPCIISFSRQLPCFLMVWP